MSVARLILSFFLPIAIGVLFSFSALVQDMPAIENFGKNPGNLRLFVHVPNDLYDKVSDMEVNVNFVERGFNVGSIRFFSGRTETDEGSTSRLYDK